MTDPTTMQNIATDATLDGLNPNDVMMARNMAEALHAHYPGHRWAVTCDSNTGIATIRDLFFSGTYGYVLKLKDIYSASQFQADVIRAGGEILERFRTKRGAFNEADYHALPVNFAGRLEFDK